MLRGQTSSLAPSNAAYFYQHLTDLLYEDIAKDVAENDTQDTSRKEALTYEERNVLRYFGGYLLRALKKKLKGFGQPCKKELEQCWQLTYLFLAMFLQSQLAGKSQWSNKHHITLQARIIIRLYDTPFIKPWQ